MLGRATTRQRPPPARPPPPPPPPPPARLTCARQSSLPPSQSSPLLRAPVGGDRTQRSGAARSIKNSTRATQRRRPSRSWPARSPGCRPLRCARRAAGIREWRGAGATGVGRRAGGGSYPRGGSRQVLALHDTASLWYQAAARVTWSPISCPIGEALQRLIQGRSAAATHTLTLSLSPSLSPSLSLSFWLCYLLL